MSARDVRALKLVLLIVLTVATIVVVSYSVNHQVNASNDRVQQLEQGPCHNPDDC